MPFTDPVAIFADNFARWNRLETTVERETLLNVATLPIPVNDPSKVGIMDERDRQLSAYE